ncbi:MAG: CBS domain-containing protein [Jiangellaceae bacterium]|nr:CBS domain-containing protein [Jiangellaceae bacterium]
MRARVLAEPFPVVHLDTDALEATRLLVDRALPGLVVVDHDGLPLFILPGSQVLRFALPEYVEQDQTLASVYSESDADALCESLRGRTVQELMPSKKFLPRRPASRPIVAPDATVMEIAAVMAEQHSPVIAVVDGGKIIGVITVHRLLGSTLPAT